MTASNKYLQTRVKSVTASVTASVRSTLDHAKAGGGIKKCRLAKLSQILWGVTSTQNFYQK